MPLKCLDRLNEVQRTTLHVCGAITYNWVLDCAQWRKLAEQEQSLALLPDWMPYEQFCLKLPSLVDCALKLCDKVTLFSSKALLSGHFIQHQKN